MFDIAVIGKGLIGSAALRHLTANFPSLRVCVIGPDEPPDRKAHRGVFASHYDQGRITRVLDPSRLWGALARESIKRYAEIEAASGITFHHRAGCLRASDLPESIAAVDDCARTYAPPYQRLDAAGCRAVYPFLRFNDDFVAWDEKGESGYINPRQFIQAQLAAAAAPGADIIREIVTAINLRAEGVSIETRAGRQLRARKVLLSAGGYSNTLPRRKLALRTKGHTILLAELPPAEIERLRAMPAIISSFKDPSVASLYMLPPVPYPDGKTYIKLGPSGYTEPYFNAVDSDSELLDWFHSDGREDIAEAMKDALHRMIPDLQVVSYHTVPCLITNSARGNPYIDCIETDRLYLATAGNGYAAKSSDEIGRIGAMLCATGEWHSKLSQADFPRCLYGWRVKVDLFPVCQRQADDALVAREHVVRQPVTGEIADIQRFVVVDQRRVRVTRPAAEDSSDCRQLVAIGIGHDIRCPRKHGHDAFRQDRYACLFVEFTNGSVGDGLARLDAAARRRPGPRVAAELQQDLSAVIHDHGRHARDEQQVIANLGAQLADVFGYGHGASAQPTETVRSTEVLSVLATMQARSDMVTSLFKVSRSW